MTEYYEIKLPHFNYEFPVSILACKKCNSRVAEIKHGKDAYKNLNTDCYKCKNKYSYHQTFDRHAGKLIVSKKFIKKLTWKGEWKSGCDHCLTMRSKTPFEWSCCGQQLDQNKPNENGCLKE